MMELKAGKKYIEIDDNAYVVSKMSAEDLYDVLCRELNFNKMITLYKLINHKMQYLDDKPRTNIAVYDMNTGAEKWNQES